MKKWLSSVLRSCPQRVMDRIEAPQFWSLGFGTTLLLSALLAVKFVDELEAEQVSVVRSYRVERELEQLLRLTVDVETETRGVAIFHDPVFLAPATDALPRIETCLKELRALAADGAVVDASLRSLEMAVRRRLEHMKVVQADAMPGKPIGISDMLESKQRQDRVRGAVEQLRIREHASQQHSMDRSARLRAALKVVVVVSMIVLAGLGWMWSRARRRLMRSEENYRHLFSSAAHGMALVGWDGRILRANASCAAILGYDSREMIGMDLVRMMHPAERARTEEMFRALCADESYVSRAKWRYLRGDGTDGWIRVSMSRTRETADGVPRVLVIAEDVSEPTRQEELLRRSAVLLQNASRMAGIDGWFLALPEGRLEVGTHIKTLLDIADDRPAALLACLTARSRRVLLRALAGCRRTGAPFHLELEASGATETIVLQVMGQSVLGVAGMAGIEGAVQDITRQRQMQNDLRRSERRCRAIAQVTNDGIWDWDVNTDTVWHSSSIAALLGLGSEALDGSREAWRRLIHPDDRAAVDSSFVPLREGTADEFKAEYRVRRADGTYAYVLDKACALRDDNGAVVRVVGGVRDLTERRRSVQALMGMAASVPDGDSNAFLRLLLTHLLAAVGADGGVIARPSVAQPQVMRTVAGLVDGQLLDEFHYDLAGTPCARLACQKEFLVQDGLATVCPDARGLPGMHARAYAGHRLTSTDGRALGVLFAAFRTPIADPDGVLAVLRVFAARAEAELERMEVTARMREQAALLDQAREAIVVLDLELNVTFWNRGAELMYGVTSRQAAGTSASRCYEEKQAPHAALAAVLASGEWRGDSVQRGEGGNLLTVEESWTLVRDDRGRPHSILKVGMDVTAKRAAEEQIRQVAHYDALTGLPNRRLLMERLRQRVLRSARSRRHGALLFIDMDNFKHLNDTHGHEAGDEFLRETARRLRACIRAEDTVARLGGDEFVILLDRLNADAGNAAREAHAIGSKIVDMFRQHVHIGTIAHLSTVSVGIVMVGAHADTPEALLRRADQAMYRAKHGGKDAIVVADHVSASWPEDVSADEHESGEACHRTALLP